MRRVGTVVLLAKRELVNVHHVLRLESALFDVVTQRGRELSFLQRIACELLHVGRERSQFHVAVRDNEIDKQVAYERIQFAADGEGRVLIDATADVDVCGSVERGRKSLDGSAEILHGEFARRLNRKVSEMQRRVREGEQSELYIQGRGICRRRDFDFCDRNIGRIRLRRKDRDKRRLSVRVEHHTARQLITGKLVDFDSQRIQRNIEAPQRNFSPLRKILKDDLIN